MREINSNSTGNLRYDPSVLSELHSVTPAEGWFAVYAECSDCETELRVTPIVLWATYVWRDGSVSTDGLVPEIGVGLVPASDLCSFLSFMGPGQTIDEILEHVGDDEED